MADRADYLNTFWLEEYKALRKEIDDRMLAINSLAQYSVTGVAAIYAWLAKGPPSDSGFFNLGLIAASLIALASCVRIGYLENRVRQIGDYIKSLETRVFAPGWETAVIDRRQGIAGLGWVEKYASKNGWSESLVSKEKLQKVVGALPWSVNLVGYAVLTFLTLVLMCIFWAPRSCPSIL